MNMAEEDDVAPLVDGEESELNGFPYTSSSNDMCREYRRISRDACCTASCCGCNYSYHCIGFTILAWWMFSGFIIIAIITLYLVGKITCDPETHTVIDCELMDIWVSTLM
eukprot:157215_1